MKRRIQDSSMGFGADIKSKKRMRLGEILSHVVPDDLVQYGMIPEFVGRFPVIATLDDLTEEDLVRILNEPKNAIVKQYKKLFQLDNIELEITKDALYAVARKALTKGTGARALKGVFEEVMIDVMFEIPSTKNVEKVVVTRESVEGKTENSYEGDSLVPSILAIETSCDETSVSILKDNQILSNIISSQIDIHAVFGGVVPEVAARHHLKNLPLVFEKAIQQADISLSQIDAIAVTTGPGLAGSLLVGISFAKGVAIALEKPLIGVNHLLAHVFAAKLAFSELEPPYLALLVSGGHTELLMFENSSINPVLLGRTLDDAAGEAFDKVARLLEIGYPGGPAIEQLSLTGNPYKYRFPRAMLEEGNLNFSFSGVKTSVLYTLKENEKICKPDIAASFQEAVVDVLIEKTAMAVRMTDMKKVVVVGALQQIQDSGKK